jgi:hypothetical protein
VYVYRKNVMATEIAGFWWANFIILVSLNS